MMALALLPLIWTAWLGIQEANWWPLVLITVTVHRPRLD